MVKRALTLLTSILIALPLLMPFNIFADESVNTAPFLGVNVQFTEVETEYTSMTMPILNFGYAGTQNTTGSVTGKMACSALSAGECKAWSLQNSNGNSVAGLSFSMNLANLKITENGVWNFNKAYNYIVDYEFVLDGDYKGYVVLNGESKIYVNGRSFHHSIRQTGINENTFTITDYQLYLITDPIIWNFPVESLGFIYEFKHQDILGIKEYNYYQYPIFKFNANYSFKSLWDTSTSMDFDNITIFGINKNIYKFSELLRYIEISNITLSSFNVIVRKDGVNAFTIVRLEYSVDESSNFVTFKSLDDSNTIMPIYKNYKKNKYISTEFALLYGLSNILLDNIDLIANGTVQSNSAAQSSDSANSQLQTDSNTLFQQENGFKSDMQNAMKNVNNTFRLQDMGTKFVSSAQWVRTQYEKLTNNTPFASLITFSLITGLALILLGKVYK